MNNDEAYGSLNTETGETMYTKPYIKFSDILWKKTIHKYNPQTYYKIPSEDMKKAYGGIRKFEWEKGLPHFIQRFIEGQPTPHRLGILANVKLYVNEEYSNVEENRGLAYEIYSLSPSHKILLMPNPSYNDPFEIFLQQPNPAIRKVPVAKGAAVAGVSADTTAESCEKARVQTENELIADAAKGGGAAAAAAAEGDDVGASITPQQIKSISKYIINEDGYLVNPDEPTQLLKDRDGGLSLITWSLSPDQIDGGAEGSQAAAEYKRMHGTDTLRTAIKNGNKKDFIKELMEHIHTIQSQLSDSYLVTANNVMKYATPRAPSDPHNANNDTIQLVGKDGEPIWIEKGSQSQIRNRNVENAKDAIPGILHLKTEHHDELIQLKQHVLRHLNTVYGVDPNNDYINLYFHFPYGTPTITLHLHIRVNQAMTPCEALRSFFLDEVIDCLKPEGGGIENLIENRMKSYTNSPDEVGPGFLAYESYVRDLIVACIPNEQGDAHTVEDKYPELPNPFYNKELGEFTREDYNERRVEINKFHFCPNPKEGTCGEHINQKEFFTKNGKNTFKDFFLEYNKKIQSDVEDGEGPKYPNAKQIDLVVVEGGGKKTSSGKKKKKKSKKSRKSKKKKNKPTKKSRKYKKQYKKVSKMRRMYK